jgi:hypothetical protein
MRARFLVIGGLVLVAATVGPPRQASVRLIATPTAVGVSPAVIGSDGLVVAVILNNLGDGDAWLSDVSVEGGTSWRLLNPWEPTVLAAGNQVSVDVYVDPQAQVDRSTLVVVAEGLSVEPVGCSPGVEVTSDSLEVTLYSGSIDGCDTDGDGFIAGRCGGDDCDEGDAAVNPQATERCNGIDDDCNGAIDEAGAVGEQEWFNDVDVDGFGDPEQSMWACTSPVLWVSDFTDCDDGNASVNPQVVEQCNTVDDDCDGDVDEGFVRQPWYADRDGDDAGRQGSSPVYACAAPAGFVRNDDDCVDADARTQSCTCGIEGPSAQVRGLEFVSESHADSDALLSGPDGYFGDAAVVADVTGDGCAEVLVSGDGKLWIFEGPVYGELGIADAIAIISGDDASFGQTLATADLNSDGVDDVIIAAPDSGALYLFHAPLSGNYGAADADVVLTTGTVGTELGASLATGDVSGDGVVDLVVGETDATASGGSVWVLFGPVVGDHVASVRADVAIQGGSAGTSVAIAGDMDGDGWSDLVVGGVPPRDPGLGYGMYDQRGTVGLYRGPFTVDRTHPADADRIWGAELLDGDGLTGSAAGHAVIAPGDMNGDGRPDVVASAPEASEDGYDGYSGERRFGALGIVFGGDTVSGIATSVAMNGEYIDTPIGGTLAAVGDVDGDGYSDFLTTHLRDNRCRPSGGSVALVTGAPDLRPGLGFSASWRRRSLDSDAKLGSALAGGDTNADGFSDLVVASKGSGQARVYYGAPWDLPPEPVYETGFSLCIEGPEGAPDYPMPMQERLTLDAVIVDPDTVTVPPRDTAGFQTCPSSSVLVAAVQTDTGDVWAVYGTRPLPDADLSVGSPLWVDVSGRIPDGAGGCGSKETVAFADSRGLLYAKSTRGLAESMSHLLQVQGACVFDSFGSGSSRVALDGQTLPSQGTAHVEIQGGTALASGRGYYDGGNHPCGSFGFTLSRIQDAPPL